MDMFSEQRRIFLFKTFGENMKEYGKDLKTYISEPYKNGDPIQMVTGPVMAAASLILEGPDVAYAGIVDQSLQSPEGTFGRITRDTRSLANNVFTLHPLKALGDASRLVFSDIPLTIGDAVGGFRN